MNSILPIEESKDVQTLEEWLPREDGTWQRILIHLPRNAKVDVPGVVWLHSGRSVAQFTELDRSITRQLIAVSDCVVVMPDYRYRIGDARAYGEALRDCHDALLWLKDNAGWFGVRADQIAVGGSGHGGALTAALTVYARDRGEVEVAFQMPIGPVIEEPAWMGNSGGAVCAPPTGAGLGTPRLRLVKPSNKELLVRATVARNNDLRVLPPTLTYVDSQDPFRGETSRYVSKLKAAGVPVQFKVFECCARHVDGIPCEQAAEFRARWLRRAVRSFFAPQQALLGRSGRRRRGPSGFTDRVS